MLPGPLPPELPAPRLRPELAAPRLAEVAPRDDLPALLRPRPRLDPPAFFLPLPRFLPPLLLFLDDSTTRDLASSYEVFNIFNGSDVSMLLIG